MSKNELLKALQERTPRSAWNKGVNNYAIDLVDGLEIDVLPKDKKALETLLLNGAKDWADYSQGGCALVYDGDIAQALCTPSELKATRNGERNPNRNETWLDVQARALYQAFKVIKRVSIQVRG